MTLAADAKDTLKTSAMASGRFVDPWNVRPEDVFIEDIARGLAFTNRYNGQFGSYSVAQHSIFVSRIVEPHRQLAALLHDAPEFLTGDLAHHIKYGRGFLGHLWRQLDDPIQAAVEARFGLEPGDLYDAAIKRADNKIFNLEWDHFVNGNEEPFLRPWPGEQAEEAFIDSFNVYTGRA